MLKKVFFKFSFQIYTTVNEESVPTLEGRAAVLEKMSKKKKKKNPRIPHCKVLHDRQELETAHMPTAGKWTNHYCCCSKGLHTIFPHRERPEFQSGPHWATIKASAGLCSSLEAEREILLLPFLASGGHPGPFHFQTSNASRGFSRRVTPDPRSCLLLPFLRTLVMTLGPPGQSKIISPAPGLLVCNLNSMCSLGSSLPSHLLYPQFPGIRHGHVRGSIHTIEIYSARRKEQSINTRWQQRGWTSQTLCWGKEARRQRWPTILFIWSARTRYWLTVAA